MYRAGSGSEVLSFRIERGRSSPYARLPEHPHSPLPPPHSTYPPEYRATTNWPGDVGRQALFEAVARIGLRLPQFVWSLLVGVLIRNVAELTTRTDGKDG